MLPDPMSRGEHSSANRRFAVCEFPASDCVSSCEGARRAPSVNRRATAHHRATRLAAEQRHRPSVEQHHLPATVSRCILSTILQARIDSRYFGGSRREWIEYAAIRDGTG